jgi:hypothetical protein
MTPARLRQLAELADMMRSRDLARLGKLAQQRQELATRIDRLSSRVTICDDPAVNAARLAHAKWAQAQRSSLNTALAQQTAQMLEQKAIAARSVGRALALARLKTRSR